MANPDAEMPQIQGQGAVAPPAPPAGPVTMANEVFRLERDPEDDSRPRRRQRIDRFLLDHKMWKALQDEGQKAMHVLDKVYAENECLLPSEAFVGKGQYRFVSRYVLPGLHGRATESMLAMKYGIRSAVNYAQDVRIVRFKQRAKIQALIDALSSIDLPPPLKALLASAQAAFDTIDGIMDAGQHVEHIKFPDIQDAPDP